MRTRNDRQRRAEKAIFAALEPAGWKRTVKSETFEVADLTYGDGRARLEVEHRWWQDAVYLTLDAPDGTDDLTLRVEYGDALPGILDYLLSIQDSASWEARDELVDAVARLCPDTYRVTPTELVKVSAGS